MRAIAVHGATGKMGVAICQMIDASPGFELVGAVDVRDAGRTLGEVVPGLGVAAAALRVEPSLDALSSRPDAVVDFSVAAAALDALLWCRRNGVDAVSGTTGLSGEQIEELARQFATGAAHAILAPNYAITAVLLVRLAEIAAAHLDGVEIIELHHDQKQDAPSGTALATVERLAAARALAGKAPLVDPTTSEALPGARGGAGPGGIHVHAVRLPGLVAHEEVIFGARGQSLTIRQDSYDRSSFLPGIELALRRVRELPGLTIGLDKVLGL